MKNLFKSLMLVAVAAMAFTACQKDNGEVNAVAKKTVINFTAGFDADTRSYFGDKVGKSYPSFWEGGEQVTFVAPAADYDGTYTAYAQAVKLDDEGKSATFTVEFPSYAPIKPGTVKAYLGEYWNTGDDYAYVDEYYTQTPRANSVDPRFHLASTSFVYDGESLDFAGKFEHGVAYGKMTVNGFEDKKISEVTIELFKNEGEGMYQNSKRYRLNTAELDTHTYWFAAEACEAKKFTVSVVADEVTYVKSVELTAENPLNFNVGRVSTFSVSNLALPLDTPIINASFADGKVTATWGAIANAVAYKVEVNGEVVEEACKETSYTFDAEYNTQYEIAVTALAEENSVQYSDSDKGSTSFKTPMDINMETDYEVTLKSYTVSGSTYKFTGDTDNDWIQIPFHTLLEGDLPAGSYTGVYSSGSFSQTSALEYDWYNTCFNLADCPSNYVYYCSEAGLVVVERENNSFKVTAIVIGYIDGSNKTVKYVYEETNEEPAEPAGIVFTSSLLDAEWGFGDFYIGLSDDSGLMLCLNFYNCQDTDKNFLPEGTYNVQTDSGGIFLSDECTYAAKGSEKYGITEGAVVVSEVNGVYKFDIALVAKTLGAINGTYEGAIEGLVVPSEWTEQEPEVTYDYDITFTKCENLTGNTLTFTNDNGYKWVMALTNPLAEGVLKDEAGNWDGNSTTIEVPGVSFPGYCYSGTFTVTKDGDNYAISFITDPWINGVQSNCRFAFNGPVEAPSSSGPDLTGYSEGTGAYVDYKSVYGTVRFKLTYIEEVVLTIYPFYGNEPEVHFTVGSTSVETLTLSGLNAQSGTVDLYQQADGSYLVMVDATFQVVGAKKFYFYVTL